MSCRCICWSLRIEQELAVILRAVLHQKTGYNPSGVTRKRKMMRFGGKLKGIITAAAVQFSPDNTVQITADFITTGEIQIRMKTL